MMVGEGSDLRQVRDAQDLVGGGQLFEAAADSFGGTATNAGVDFVEDQGALGAARWVGQARLEGQRDARDLAAGCDLFQRAGLFAKVGRDQEIDLIGAFGRSEEHTSE